MSWGQLAAVAALYFGGVKLGMLTVLPEGMAVFWPPNAVVLAALLRFDGARLPLLGAVVVAAEVAASVPAFSPVEAVLFGLINFGEAAGAFLVLRRMRFDPRLSSLAQIGRFVLAGPLVAAGVASLFGAAVYSVFRAGETGYLELARTWWSGDALGLLIVTPLLLGFPPFRTMRNREAPFTRLDLAVVAGGLLAALAMWHQALPTVLMVAFVLYFAVRHTPRWTALAVAACVAWMVLALTRGVPIGPVSGAEAVVYVQRFIFVLAVLGLGFSALLAQLRDQHAALEQRVAERTDALERVNAELARLAVLDSLTGVGNRRSFDRALEREAERARRYGRPLALVLADLDSFKRVNDTFGHAAGDEVIRAFARLLTAAVRGTDLVVRYGGEEFAVLMPETTAEEAGAYAERARAALAGLQVAPVSWPLTSSFGVAQIDDGGAQALVAAADSALYEAKRSGRNRVVTRHAAADADRVTSFPR